MFYLIVFKAPIMQRAEDCLLYLTVYNFPDSIPVISFFFGSVLFDFNHCLAHGFTDIHKGLGIAAVVVSGAAAFG